MRPDASIIAAFLVRYRHELFATFSAVLVH